MPAGVYNNRKFRESTTEFDPSVDRLTQDVLFDPQTSGGLLILTDPQQLFSREHREYARSIYLSLEKDPSGTSSPIIFEFFPYLSFFIALSTESASWGATSKLVMLRV